MTTRTRNVYHSVIQDVINNVRPQFFNGPGENILENLQATWEGKMIQAGVIGTPAVDLNVPVFPPSPLHAPVQPQQPLPVTGGNLYDYTPTGVSYMQPPYPTGVSYMQSPHPGMTSQTWQTSDGGFIQQQGGPGGVVKIEDNAGSSSSSSSSTFMEVEGGSSCSTSVKVELGSSSSTSVEVEGVRVDLGDVEPPLNEDDDDDPDDPEDGEEELNAQNLVLAQFEKVTRTKSKWKCTLKNGIMHLNNRDVLFHECKGEFDF